MSILLKSQIPVRKIEIDLTGPEGNVFYLFGVATNIGKKLNLDYQVIIEEMKESDYENAIRVFDKYFGDYVILYR